ncbi:MAG: hypothetical protein J2P15_01245 [Micromonosporaceae bacterium]|nr:hypothetical protein [Micromonosporaceae bacterium]
MKAKGLRSVVVLLSLTVLCGCTSARAGEAPAAHGASDPPGSPFFPPPTSTGRLAAPQHFPAAGIDLAVPPSAASPAISATQAYALCSTGDAICVPGKAPTIQLAIANVPKTGKIGPRGELISSIVDALAYVMIWTGAPCLAAGGPPGSSQPPVQSCTVIDLIDARSGRVLYSYQGTRP